MSVKSSRCKRRGFTLVELLIAVAIVAILAKIAFPSYASYITKSRTRDAMADLTALASAVENQYQLSLTYPSPNQTTTADTKTKFSAWAPTQSSYFDYTYTVGTPANSYTVTATGVTTTAMNGCTLSVTGTGVTSASGCIATWP